MHHHFTAIGLVMISVAVVIGVGVGSFNSAVGTIYGSAISRNGSVTGTATPITDPEVKIVEGIAREGVRWNQVVRQDAHMWAFVLLITGVILLGYHVVLKRKYKY